MLFANQARACEGLGSAESEVRVPLLAVLLLATGVGQFAFHFRLLAPRVFLPPGSSFFLEVSGIGLGFQIFKS